MPPVAALRSLLAQRFPDAVPLAYGVARPVASGIAALDAALPNGGFPRGKLTAWHSQGGAAAVLRMACRTAVAAGERAAWIDGARTLELEPGTVDDILIFRPADPLHALRSAETLLRCGGLGLVVLTGAKPEGTAAVRLTRAAREGGSAFVVIAEQASVAALRINSRFLMHGYTWALGPWGTPALPSEATLEVEVRTLGWHTRTTIVLPVMSYELRLSLDPGLADRRGVAHVER